MNPVIEHLLSHRSIRKFKNEPLPQKHVVEAVRAGQAASTSSAIQAYSVLQVTDRAKRETLVELTCNQPYVASAGAFFVVCGDDRRLRVSCEHQGGTYEQRLEGFLLSVIDASLFAQNMAIAFESIGYGICYIGGLRNALDKVDSLLGIPHGVYPLFGMCVGVPDQQPLPRPRFDTPDVLHVDSFRSDQALGDSIRAYDEVYEKYLIERGASPSSWSQAMGGKFDAPIREYLAEYYASKGANLG
ncbi:MAG: NADPH-dependent oxidoreductase [Planctomycetota bacterium]|jgi:FMN reductase (NADPH)